jgi:rhomboid protease GluP
MFKRQRTGSVVCPSCGRLVGVNDEKCYNCGRPRPGMWGFTPLLRRFGQDLGFVELMIGGCALLYLATLVVDVRGIHLAGGFSFLSPSGRSVFLFGASGAVPVFLFGRWWTLLSAAWLHGGLLHILFNVLWIRQLAPAVAQAYGPGRMVIIYTLSGVAGFAVSTAGPVFLPFLAGLLGGPGYTVGASASIFGLLGALVWYGRRVSTVVGRQAWMYALVLLAFGFLWGTAGGDGPRVDNWAHVGGFAGGLATAALLNPMKPERPDHGLAALACLLLSLAAIVASVVTGLPVLRAGG